MSLIVIAGASLFDEEKCNRSGCFANSADLFTVVSQTLASGRFWDHEGTAIVTMSAEKSRRLKLRISCISPLQYVELNALGMARRFFPFRRQTIVNRRKRTPPSNCPR